MRILLGLMTSLALGGTAWAQTTMSAPEAVVREQLEAFDTRDVARAWSHASDTIKGLFGSIETFARMVEQGYPPIWDSAGARLIGERAEGGRQIVEMAVTGENGREQVFEYTLIETAQGWKIDGVRPIELPGLAV
ncbi:hypothetical protein AQS8620_02741 [Aquimixticola soesokkakensis]|uniref:DUF4864 domain-containing protein n=1 Tax=Aquimixticola soesokkakensis TaxID=1519096 RepID=A0A1Y5TC24_9RHOB|nr:DUF4864 domain-containing protein [Aquimixticola soesokkakensis]SLN60640.1 hypothetical protein AQS8620_02741 [Aquimixticola soesokkakensis]